LRTDLRSRLGPARSSDVALRAALRLVQLGPLLVLLILIVMLAILSPFFLTARNFTNLGFQTSVVAVLAMGQLLVILTRGVDLSVGSVVGLSGVVGAAVADATAGGGPVWVIASMLGVGFAVGLINGVVLVKGRLLNAFIVTLGTLSVVRGVALLVSDAKVNTGMPDAINSLGNDVVGAIPIPTLLVLGIAAMAWVGTRRTQWGRWIYAIGGSPESAKRIGLPVDRLVISVYVLCGLTAGIAGILVAARTDAGSPNAGQLLELDSITAVIIGGASFFGGRGNVLNVIVGALIIGVIRNGLNLLDVSPFWQLIAIGTLVIVSLEIDVVRAYLENRLKVARAGTST
jgi:ribose transport system permease protein